MPLRYRQNYQANPYAQQRKGTTVKYLGSAKSTNKALPRSNLSSLNRAYMQYVGPYPPEHYANQYDASRPKSATKGYGKDRTNPPKTHMEKLVEQQRQYHQDFYYETYGPKMTQRAFGKRAPGDNPLINTMAKPAQGPPVNQFEKPYLPWYARGWHDPTGFIDRYVGQRYTLGVPKSIRTPPGTAGFKYKTDPEGYTELPPFVEQPQYGGYGGYGGGHYPGWGGGAGSYERSAPSGGAPQPGGGANVRFAGQGQDAGMQTGYRLPQWYRKLLSWNF